MITGIVNATFEVEVLRWDSKWIPFTYRLSYAKQRDLNTHDCIREVVEVLAEVGGVPGAGSMKVGEYRRYRLAGNIIYTQDYWGECDIDFELRKVRRIK